MKTKESINQYTQDISQDLEAIPSDNDQKSKAQYMLNDATDRFYYGACPECGKEGQLNSIDRDIWGYCEEHNTAWYIPDNPYDPQGGPEFCQIVDDRGYIKVVPIMTSLETPENKAAMLKEMRATTITTTSEIHLIDQEVQFKECYGLQVLPNGCSIQIRFEKYISDQEVLEFLKLIKEKLEVNTSDLPW